MRHFERAIALVASLAWAGCAGTSKPPPTANGARSRFVYVGTYTGPGIPPDGLVASTAQGIYVFKMSLEDGGLTLVDVAPTDNPSFLAFDPTLTHLYCTNQSSAPMGRVSAFAIDAASGKLTLLNTRPTNGGHPAHLSVHPSGKYLLASNYEEGDYPIYRLLANGAIGPMTDDARGSGSGPDEDRQEGPHAHQILTDADGRHVFGVDLGADRVFVWNLDLASGVLIPTAATSPSIAPGSGPRHLAFHPNRKNAYLLNELNGSVTSLRYDADRGALATLQTTTTLPPDFVGSKSTSEIRVHPDGRFLYTSNRGHNSVSIFRIDDDTGMLTIVGWEPTRGEWPRGMNIDPTGSFLYVANQRSDSIVVFRIDRSSGRLLPTGQVVHTPTPVDIELGPSE